MMVSLDTMKSSPTQGFPIRVKGCRRGEFTPRGRIRNFAGGGGFFYLLVGT